jgi:glycerol uptake facilitator protein
VKWAQLPVYWAAELLAGVLAALAYTVISRTAADAATVAEPQTVGETPVPVSPEGGPPAVATLT